MPSWKKVIISGSNAALNSLTVSNGITGSLFGTASYATVAANGGVTQLLAGSNITLAPTNGLGQVTISSTSGGGGFNTATGSYGSFYDTTTQTNPVANTPRSMSLNTTDITNGVSVSGSTNPFNTYIKTQNAGVYNIQFSAQLDKTDSGTDEVVIWLRKNGTDLTDTATTITLSGNNDKQVAAWNWFVNSAANDYYQIIWYSADTDLRLLAEVPGGGHPGIPSVIVTANRVDQFLSNTGSFSGSFTGQFTGSLLGTASFATSASYAATASNIQGGAANYIPIWNTATSLSSSAIYQSASNIGIGTTTPFSKFTTYGALSTSTSQISVVNSEGGHIILRTGISGVSNSGLSLISADVAGTNQNTRLVVSSTGNVGIGTTAPSQKLQITQGSSGFPTLGTPAAGALLIAGDSNLYGTYFGIDSNSGKSYLQAMRNDSAVAYSFILNPVGGNIGIGTTAPNAKLDVNGNTIITGSLQISSSIFQYSNNAAITSGSTANIASFPTSSYMAGFFDYVASSNGNARAGTVFTVWNGASLEFTETSTNDIGSTTNLVLSASLLAGAVRLQGTSLSGSWNVKTLTRMI